MSSAVNRLNSIMGKIDRVYGRNWMTRHGLYYEDLFHEYKIVHKAIARLPADVRKDRERRKTRAIECFIKNKEIAPELQNFDPYVTYGLSDLLREVRQEDGEIEDYV
eukprot:TRINITY_DN117780_c0_g1_i1.p1 TRINITY_DN117780_c0_g1~~TRINITY_DN117780_c0_g1_i1.p1  ORF type:complete len:107 (+),score=22.92 TRINITY_DN117780_c0_g1_i1:22-342(+)